MTERVDRIGVWRRPASCATPCSDRGLGGELLVVLALLTARVVSGTDPSLHASASSAVVVSHSGRTVVRTTASGRG